MMVLSKGKQKMHINLRHFFVVIALAAGVQPLDAGDATWKLNPVNNDWNTAQNWRPQTIPDSETAVATFDVSNTTTVLCQESADRYAQTLVGEVIFAPGASAYTIRVTPDPDVILYPSYISLNGAGITNNSGVTQNLVAANRVNRIKSRSSSRSSLLTQSSPHW